MFLQKTRKMYKKLIVSCNVCATANPPPCSQYCVDVSLCPRSWCPSCGFLWSRVGPSAFHHSTLTLASLVWIGQMAGTLLVTAFKFCRLEIFDPNWKTPEIKQGNFKNKEAEHLHVHFTCNYQPFIHFLL